MSHMGLLLQVLNVVKHDTSTKAFPTIEEAEVILFS